MTATRRGATLYRAVCETIKPGATCGDLVRAAMSVETKYGLAHFYLGHGVGCDSAEAPFIGSDLGLAFDDTVELAPGMVFVLEPVVWRDGVGGYRSEELIVVTDGGYEQLTAYGYTPVRVRGTPTVTAASALKTPNLGTGITEDRDRVDFGALRRPGTDRLFGWMEAMGLDACVLGREANVRYATGARRLWTALSRPFGPTCIVVRATRDVHLLSFSASYEGHPGGAPAATTSTPSRGTR